MSSLSAIVVLRAVVVRGESVVVGMGERYDAVITAGDGVFAVVAEALGKRDQAMAILRAAAT